MKPTVDEVLKQTLEVLRSGGIIVYPTDTIWGIGCDATNPAAVRKVYEIKQRSDSKALVLLAANLDMVARYVKVIPPIAVDLVEVNDKPMTLIYPQGICGKAPAAGEQEIADRHFLAWNAVAEDGSVGIRIPMHEFCRNLSYKLGRPIVSTSANISGEPAPTCFQDIPQAILDAADYVVPSFLDKESTGLASQIIKVEVDGQVKIIRA